jgi:TonB-linked SusC/RagA family outer membrane protein
MKKKSPAIYLHKTRLAIAVLGMGLLLTARVVTAQTADTVKPELLKKIEKVPVLFGEQTKIELLQSYGIIKGSSIESIPVGQVEGALYGKLGGLYLVQGSGKPGSDQPSISLRGRSPLVIIDGVPRTFTSIDPQQIESISVLKDGLATAMYGMRASDGILFIKTKRGSIAPRKISFTAQTAVQQQLNQPSFLHAFDYATLFNEALANDGKPPVYSADDLDKYKNQTSPYTHPDVDWYNTILKNQAGVQRYNLNISGGSKLSRYFVGLDYMNQQGFFISDNKANTYPTNNFYKRYVFRSNIDVDLTKSTLLSLNVFGRIRNGNEPGAGTDAIYDNILATPNNAYPVFNADNTLGGNPQYSNNIYGQTLRSGYRPTYNRNLGVDVALKQNLDFIKGLYVRASTSFNSYYDESINRSKSFAVYDFQINPVTGDTTIQKIGTDAAQTNSSSVSSQNRQIYNEFALGYDTEKGRHGFQSTVLFNSDNYVTGYDLPLNNYGFAARAQYNYNQTYFAEVAGSYMAMNRYPKNKQWGFFPAVGLGWNMSNEKWFHVPAISNLKWRATYGKTGDNSGAGYYVYQQFYNSGSTYYFQNPSTSNSTLNEGTLANPNITWEKARKFNAGADISFFNNKLELTVDYYDQLFYDLLQQRGTNASTIIGNTLPSENMGERRYTGFETSLEYNDHVGAFNWIVKANASLNKSKIIYMDEVIRPFAYQRRTGLPLGQPFGLTAIGFYQSQTDITNSPVVEGYNPVPGDIKFKDTNGDGIINVFDETAIGSTKPLFFYGLTAGFNWKGLDFSMLWNGVTNRNVWTNNSNTLEFQQNSNGGYGQAFAHHLNRWTAATAATATYPRLSLDANPNNHRNSTFWLKDGSYLRLRNVELGYTLPTRWTNIIRISKARAFVNALNLLTFSKLERVDPEVINWEYPNQRVINFGINIQF